MKNKQKTVTIAAMSCLLAAAVLLSAVMSYLIDQKNTDNIFTLGTVNVSLTETDYPKDPKNRVLVPYGSIEKNPQIANIGENDAFVFMKVTVPKINVEPVNENGSLKYSDKLEYENGERKFQTDKMEIFKLISDEPVSKRAAQNEPTGLTEQSEKNLYDKTWYELDDIDYNENWYLIDKTIHEDSDTNTYLFAYKSVLVTAAHATQDTTYNITKTDALFDKVQLKTFVEDETLYENFQKINIEAYAIQADDLMSITDFNKSEFDKKNPAVWQLKRIYDVYKNQSEVGGS